MFWSGESCLLSYGEATGMATYSHFPLRHGGYKILPYEYRQEFKLTYLPSELLIGFI